MGKKEKQLCNNFDIKHNRDREGFFVFSVNNLSFNERRKYLKGLFWQINGKTKFSGGQPPEVFLKAFETAAN